MSDTVIKVENLSKLYRIGSHQNDYRTLRDTIAQSFETSFSLFRNLSSYILHRPSAFSNRSSSILHHPSAVENGTIWALKDVSFEIKRGEVVGIIGRNGAGKSTLLKILSRITEPTEGYAEIHGRVGSLLEVGTGFHPELTGRENIYLNGAILGMRKAEIEQKFDEIVAFAEVEKFIDTPVKHYSSGMYVRLAFAVAAHLEPEILLVDEVLSVGDLTFQKKCLGRMGDVAKRGRTVIFVSHQMNQIRRLCDKCMLVDGGQLKNLGNTAEVVSAYEVAFSSAFTKALREPDDGHVPARFLRWEIVEPNHAQTNILSTTGPVELRFFLKVNKPIHKGVHGIALFNNDGQLVWGKDTRDLSFECGVYEITYRLTALPLRPSTYFWRVSLFDNYGLLDMWDCLPELVLATEPLTHSRDEWAGILNIPCKLSIGNYKEAE
jgi:lipopolysaccharide transport system ATP-binding protein